jgi:virulence-associated protein VapD
MIILIDTDKNIIKSNNNENLSNVYDELVKVLTNYGVFTHDVLKVKTKFKTIKPIINEDTKPSENNIKK